ncbi:hypothetical protein E3Q19_01393 [Wallemia mellicola]|nr:hypothetical protein E3Q19_01393 [Wallemia mellicola]
MGLARTPPKLQFKRDGSFDQEVDDHLRDIQPDNQLESLPVERDITPTTNEDVEYLKRQVNMLSTRNKELTQSKFDLQLLLENTLNEERNARKLESDAMIAHINKQRDLHKTTLGKWKNELAIQTANREEIERRYLATEEELDNTLDQLDSLKDNVSGLEAKISEIETSHKKELDKHKKDFKILEEKRKKDAAAYEEKIVTLKDQSNRKDLDRKIQRYQAKIDSLETDVDTLKDKLETAKEDQAELEQADATISDLRRSLEKAQKEAKSSKSDRSLERKLKSAENECDRLKDDLRHLENSIDRRVRDKIEELNEGLDVRTLQKQLNKQKDKAATILADLKEAEKSRMRAEKEIKLLKEDTSTADEERERADRAERKVKKLEQQLQEATRRKDDSDDEPVRPKLSKKPTKSSIIESDDDIEEERPSKSSKLAQRKKRRSETDDEEIEPPKAKRPTKDASSKESKRAPREREREREEPPKKSKKKLNIFGGDPAMPQKSGADNGVFGLPDILSPVKSKSAAAKPAIVQQLDVTDSPDIIEKKVKEAINFFGRVDVLVNNAGYSQAGCFEELTDEEIRKQFDTNVFGPVKLTKAFLPYFRSTQTESVICAISSAVGITALPLISAYSSSKFALEGFFEGLDGEIRGSDLPIRVSIIEPGMFKTDFISNVQKAQTQIGQYDSLRQQSMTRMVETLSKAGDAAIGAKLIADALLKEGFAANKDIPLRLPIGTDSVETSVSKFKQTSDIFSEWRPFAAESDPKA